MNKNNLLFLRDFDRNTRDQILRGNPAKNLFITFTGMPYSLGVSGDARVKVKKFGKKFRHYRGATIEFIELQRPKQGFVVRFNVDFAEFALDSEGRSNLSPIEAFDKALKSIEKKCETLGQSE